MFFVYVFFSLCALASEEVTLSAAMSFKDCAQDIKAIYPHKLNLNFASSGKLRLQIENGAPADLYISASDHHMNLLEKSGFVQEKFILAQNSMVLASHEKMDFDDLLKPQIKYISIGNPKSVPAGRYAKEVLTSLKLWDKLKNKIVFGEHVRQVTSYLLRKEVDAAIIFKSDAIRFKDRLPHRLLIDTNLHSPIHYPAALLKKSHGKKFYHFLKGKEVKKIIQRRGFSV